MSDNASRRGNVRRIGADENRLAHDGGALADDQAAAAAVVRAANLAPFATALELGLAGLEQNVDADRVDLLGVVDAVLAALEPGFALGRAHELDFYILSSEEAFVARDQPRKRKDGASGDIVGDFSRQRRPR